MLICSKGFYIGLNNNLKKEAELQKLLCSFLKKSKANLLE